MLTKELLDQYKTDYFIETGTHGGRAVLMALELGIPNIRSVEVWEKMHKEFAQELGYKKGVNLYHGDSPDTLPKMMFDIEDQMVIFLDAHGAVVTEDREKYGKSPVLFEIAAIAKHPRKNHIIMVDDIDDFADGQYTDIYGLVTPEMIKREIYKIDIRYQFEKYGEPGATILVAHL